MREKWVEASKITGNEELARKFSVSPMAMRLIRSRAGESEAEVREYLCGTIEELADPYLMKGMREAVSLLREKIREGASIRIIGDYDIDGVNATHILITALRRCGAQADTVIPDRMKDGYGINEHLIGDAKKAGVDTIITCDNGIAAAKEIAFAKELGMTVIVTDHHDIPYQEEADGSRTVILPPADVIVNPKQLDCRYPFKKLCGAAVAWRLAEALYREEGVPREEFLDLAEFAAVATVGDIMDLTGENRILVKYGLKR
ncbi:MAG TPA: DHH family phosphoesterase, partial [Candidatus Merdisoma faecalis]|nr:DHH family phosphoesterase [Candidatus Merdisoma faecalis]